MAAKDVKFGDSARTRMVEGVNILLERGWTPYDVLTKALVEGMRIVGIDFRDGILFVPEVLLAARDWTVTLFDARGQQAAELSWRFPLDMAGLRALHGRHVANMLRLEQDIGARCEPDRTDEVI